ncbi:MAG: hypothetical protein AAFW87_12485 [Pseudomonadota bacterium]
MSDAFKNMATTLTGPIRGIDAVTMPSDTQDLSTVTRALNVSQSGFVQVTTVDGYVGRIFVAAGIAFPVRATRIWATGTTAQDIVALF